MSRQRAMEVARPGLSEEVVFEMKPKCREGGSHTRTGDVCAWRGNDKCKGPEGKEGVEKRHH